MGDISVVGVLTLVMYLPVNYVFGQVRKELLGITGQALENAAQQSEQLGLLGMVPWSDILPLVPSLMLALTIWGFVRSRMDFSS